MKSILYVGATLMVAASIYGFVDYKQTSQKKEFKDMYTEKKAIVPAVVTDVETTEPVVKNEVTKQTKNNVTKKRVVTTEEDDVTVIPAKENKAVTVKKKRKISAKLFSRAPLREDDEEELPVSSKKKELKKLEIKE